MEGDDLARIEKAERTAVEALTKKERLHKNKARLEIMAVVVAKKILQNAYIGEQRGKKRAIEKNDIRSFYKMPRNPLNKAPLWKGANWAIVDVVATEKLSTLVVLSLTNDVSVDTPPPKVRSGG